MLIWEKFSVNLTTVILWGWSTVTIGSPNCLIQKRTQTLASYPQGKVPTNFLFQKLRTKTEASNPRGR